MSDDTPKHETFASALAAAQGDMGNAAKNANNPHFRKKYADLASVREAVIPHMSAHGIAVVQKVDGPGDSVTVTTLLLWAAEVHEFGALTLPLEKSGRNVAQAAGVATTYARRYQLMAVAGVAPDDDDGNGMDGTPPRNARPQRQQQQRQPPPRPPAKPTPPAVDDDLADARKRVSEALATQPFGLSEASSYFLNLPTDKANAAKVWGDDKALDSILDLLNDDGHVANINKAAASGTEK